MDKSNTIRNRQDIPEKDKWAIEDLYASDELWERELATLADDQAELESYAGRLSESGETLCAYLTRME